MLTIFAIVAALGLVAVVAVEIIGIAQDAEASKGCKKPKPLNASGGKCVH
jgi:hypothetical protein